jgi:hypothetical protein
MMAITVIESFRPHMIYKKREHKYSATELQKYKKSITYVMH